MTIDEAIIHAEEVAERHEEIKRIKAVTLEECKCAEEHRQLAVWLKELKIYKQAFEVACDLLNGCFLYGYDTDKIFEIMMDKDGVVDSESYKKFILEHLSELRGEE